MEDEQTTIFVNKDGVKIDSWPQELQEIYSVAAYTILNPNLIWVPEAGKFLPKPEPPAGFFGVAGLVHVYSQGTWQVAFNSFRNDLESASFTQEIMTRDRSIQTQEEFDAMKAGNPKKEEFGRKVIISITYPPRHI